MGGRGSSFSGGSGGQKTGIRGISDSGKVYGTEYTTLFTDGNIKFIKRNEGSTTAPLETMTKGRVYVTINTDKNTPAMVTYYDKQNKRHKQIDLTHEHKSMKPHTHHGYLHNENDSKKGAAKLTTEEKIMVDRIKNCGIIVNNKLSYRWSTQSSC